MGLMKTTSVCVKEIFSLTFDWDTLQTPPFSVRSLWILLAIRFCQCVSVLCMYAYMGVCVFPNFRFWNDYPIFTERFTMPIRSGATVTWYSLYSYDHRFQHGVLSNLKQVWHKWHEIVCPDAIRGADVGEISNLCLHNNFLVCKVTWLIL
jgi:hypothetical protein